MDARRPITPLPHPVRTQPSSDVPPAPRFVPPQLRPPVIEPEILELDARDVHFEEAPRARVLPAQRAKTVAPIAARAQAPAAQPIAARAQAPAPQPIATSAQAPAAQPIATRAQAPAAQPIATPAATLDAAPMIVVAPQPRAVAAAARPLSIAAAASTTSGSRWSTPTLDRPRWFRYAAASAGLSALVTTLVMLATSDPASASTPAPTAAEPTVIAYDPALVASPAPASVFTPSEASRDEARLLARRIALRGTRNIAAGQPRLAKRAFEEALQQDPRCRSALAGLGALDLEAKRYTSAVERLTLALEIEPRDGDVRRMLGEAHKALGHDRNASRYLGTP